MRDCNMPPAEELGIHENERNLRELNRLEPQGAEHDPPVNVSDGRALEPYKYKKQYRENIKSPDDPPVTEDRPPIEKRKERNESHAKNHPEKLEVKKMHRNRREHE